MNSYAMGSSTSGTMSFPRTKCPFLGCAGCNEKRVKFYFHFVMYLNTGLKWCMVTLQLYFYYKVLEVRKMSFFSTILLHGLKNLTDYSHRSNITTGQCHSWQDLLGNGGHFHCKQQERHDFLYKVANNIMLPNTTEYLTPKLTKLKGLFKFWGYSCLRQSA